MKSCFNTDNHSNFDLYDVTFIEFHEFIAYHRFLIATLQKNNQIQFLGFFSVDQIGRKYRFVIYASLNLILFVSIHHEYYILQNCIV